MAQDKIYLLNGYSKTGKVLEVGVEEIILDSEGETLKLFKEDILLIEYKNGTIEKYTEPYQNVVLNPDPVTPTDVAPADKELFPANYLSLNALALCNSDISGFYERVLGNRQIGIGLMGAYNFNPYASLFNAHISTLDNAKKTYDLGTFLNFYSNPFRNKTTLSYGVILKYTGFNFTSVTEKTVTVGGLVSVNAERRPASGSQLATIFTIGSHTRLTNNMFIKTFFGLGGFNLKGVYKDQYNYFQKKTSTRQGSHESRFLLKAYLGVNIGYSF